jgi:hypothetical protein
MFVGRRVDCRSPRELYLHAQTVAAVLASLTSRESSLYFSDLAPYSYSISRTLPDVLTIGWLDRSQPFPSGGGPKQFAHMLRRWFGVARVNQMRGIHECNLCREKQWPLLPLHENPSITIEGKTLFLGNWEIWIPASEGKVFASPALIIHYVEAHNYLPPPEFIAAVLNESAMGNWNAEKEFAKRTGSTG